VVYEANPTTITFTNQNVAIDYLSVKQYAVQANTPAGTIQVVEVQHVLRVQLLSKCCIMPVDQPSKA
jgi:hypothetical protein